MFTGTDPDTFALYVAPGGSVQLGGHGTFHGALYAPDCTVEITGDGTYAGAFVGKHLHLGGTATLKFDDHMGQNQLLQTHLKALVAAQANYDKGGDRPGEGAADGAAGRCEGRGDG